MHTSLASWDVRPLFWLSSLFSEWDLLDYLAAQNCCGYCNNMLLLQRKVQFLTAPFVHLPFPTNFLCDPVVLESIFYRTRLKRLINDSKTTGGLRKILTGCDNLFAIFSIISIISSCWPNRGHIGKPTGISNSAWHALFGAKGCLDHRICARTSSLHCPIANFALTQSQQPIYRAASQI